MGLKNPGHGRAETPLSFFVKPTLGLPSTRVHPDSRRAGALHIACVSGLDQIVCQNRKQTAHGPHGKGERLNRRIIAADEF